MSAGLGDVAVRPPHRAGELLTGSVASIAFTLIAVILAGRVSIGPRFLSADNIAIIGQSVAVPMVVGACSGFALLAGVVDLSIGSMVGFSSALFATLLSAGWNAWLAAAGTLLACVGCGTIGAVAIVGFGADAIAATLGTLTALRGVTFLIVGPLGSIVALQPALFEFTNQTVWNLPLLLLLTLVLTGVAAVAVNHTRVGRHVRAVGGDDRAAARAGISVAGIRVAALLLSALGAGLGGILYVGQLGSAAKATGVGLEFQVYAALMIGGYSILRGGVGNPVGGALGLLVVAGVGNVLDLRAINPYYVNIIVGILLLAAVLLDRLRGGDAYE
jgi:ribose/xylose/arabinose/galactoside ABC-type transport system permease subunit